MAIGLFEVRLHATWADPYQDLIVKLCSPNTKYLIPDTLES